MGTGEFLNPEETLSEEVFERYQEASTSDEPVIVAAFDELDRATRSSDSGKLTWRFRAERVPDVAFSATLESQWESARTPVGDLTDDGATDYTRIDRKSTRLNSSHVATSYAVFCLNTTTHDYKHGDG